MKSALADFIQRPFGALVNEDDIAFLNGNRVYLLDECKMFVSG